MPRFNVDSISIDPDEYVSKCSSREIRELVDELYGSHPFEFDDIINDALDKASVQERGTIEVRSESHRQFLINLNSLRMAWYSVEKEDADIIAILAKKYGSL
jgi:hypothetical protein